MAHQRKLGRTAGQRKALLRGLVSIDTAFKVRFDADRLDLVPLEPKSHIHTKARWGVRCAKADFC